MATEFMSVGCKSLYFWPGNPLCGQKHWPFFAIGPFVPCLLKGTINFFIRFNKFVAFKKRTSIVVFFYGAFNIKESKCRGAFKKIVLISWSASCFADYFGEWTANPFWRKLRCRNIGCVDIECALDPKGIHDGQGLPKLVDCCVIICNGNRSRSAVLKLCNFCFTIIFL